MNILIAYATTEGQTEKIANFVQSGLTAAGHEVLIYNVSDLSGGLSVSDFDGAIIAGSVHAASHQKDLELYVFANKDKLNDMPTLFLSVSLAAAFPENHQDAERYAATFVESTDWKPTMQSLVAGAVKPNFYDWFEESTLMEGDLVSHLSKELSEEKEFTDWSALSHKVMEFAKR